jgi:5-methylcytosine-specific restriction protein A
MRREFDNRTKAKAADRAKGRCERCGNKLKAGSYHYDHITPDGLGGEPTLENCQVLCLTCHKGKTVREDNPRMVKADAQRKKHLYGIRPKSRLPGSKDSPFKIKLDGSVVRR